MSQEQKNTENIQKKSMYLFITPAKVAQSCPVVIINPVSSHVHQEVHRTRTTHSLATEKFQEIITCNSTILREFLLGLFNFFCYYLVHEQLCPLADLHVNFSGSVLKFQSMLEPVSAAAIDGAIVTSGSSGPASIKSICQIPMHSNEICSSIGNPKNKAEISHIL